MPRFVEADSRVQAALFPERIEEDNPVRAIEAFVALLDLEDFHRSKSAFVSPIYDTGIFRRCLL